MSDQGDIHHKAYLEAVEFLVKEVFYEFGDVEEDGMVLGLASWAAGQVVLNKANTWRHALALFVHEANIGLDFNHLVSEFIGDPALLAKWLRGDHL